MATIRPEHGSAEAILGQRAANFDRINTLSEITHRIVNGQRVPIEDLADTNDGQVARVAAGAGQFASSEAAPSTDSLDHTDESPHPPSDKDGITPYTEKWADGSWQDEANCLGVDPDLFFPGQGGSTREAKEVCRGCPVRLQCLEFAIDNGEKFGIWGGLSERERRKLRRQRILSGRRSATA